MNFKIIVPMYNVENWLETTIKSIISQTYKNFQCVIMDDLSTDNSYNIAKKLTENDERFLIVKNTDKKYALGNIVYGTEIFTPNDEDIIVIVDGDDWLINSSVLEYLKNVYETKNCLLTYGNHINYPDGQPAWDLFEYPEEVVKNNSFREFRYLASHLRTYKYKLWKHLNKNDLKDEFGEYFKMTGDLAVMFPLLEMSSERSVFIEKPLYVYNNQNPLNDYKKDNTLQVNLDNLLRSYKKYKRLESL